MSGVNQHYLPQFLMRGFATKGGTEKSPVYKAVEHHKFRGVMTARNIKSIGAQRNFYGKEGPGSIDAVQRHQTRASQPQVGLYAEPAANLNCGFGALLP